MLMHVRGWQTRNMAWRQIRAIDQERAEYYGKAAIQKESDSRMAGGTKTSIGAHTTSTHQGSSWISIAGSA
jgi:hypothetical protein